MVKMNDFPAKKRDHALLIFFNGVLSKLPAWNSKLFDAQTDKLTQDDVFSKPDGLYLVYFIHFHAFYAENKISIKDPFPRFNAGFLKAY